MSYQRPQRKEKMNAKWGGGEFNALSRRFTRSHVWQQLDPYACRLFMDLQSQYNGFNNGDLCITWSVFKRGKWRSKSTLQQAKQRLLDAGLILCTRPGTRRRCALFALTIYDIDECNGKHDAKPTSSPPNCWLANEPVQPIQKLRAQVRSTDASNAKSRIGYGYIYKGAHVVDH